MTGTYIQLKDGHRSLVDEIDVPLLSQMSWRLKGPGRLERYARASIGRVATVYMHRLIMRATRGQFVDHINGDTLDNRRANLRFTSLKGNAQNTAKRRSCNNGAFPTSTYKGVSKCRSKWRVAFGHGAEYRFIGSFETEIEAARAYDTAAKQFIGPFARLNFPDQEITSSLHVHSHAEGLSVCANTQSGIAERRSA